MFRFVCGSLLYILLSHNSSNAAESLFDDVEASQLDAIFEDYFGAMSHGEYYIDPLEEKTPTERDTPESSLNSTGSSITVRTTSNPASNINRERIGSVTVYSLERAGWIKMGAFAPSLGEQADGSSELAAESEACKNSDENSQYRQRKSPIMEATLRCLIEKNGGHISDAENGKVFILNWDQLVECTIEKKKTTYKSKRSKMIADFFNAFPSVRDRAKPFEATLSREGFEQFGLVLKFLHNHNVPAKRTAGNGMIEAPTKRFRH